ncbi:MAG: hypothetical protein WD059_04670 [Balneolaceae bacterium]
MSNTFKFDLRLVDISFELYAIEEHFELAENEIEKLSKKEKEIAEKILTDEKIEFNSPDWYDVVNQSEQKIHTLIPRFFRNPFLVSLYSIYESGVTEIADKIREKKGIDLLLNDINGPFLDKAKKYYSSILDFNLSINESNWNKIKVLSEIRHAIAHTNGRIDLLRPNAQKKIRKYAEGEFKMNFDAGFLIAEKETSEKLKNAVVDSLKALVQRYKNWDSNHSV